MATSPRRWGVTLIKECQTSICKASLNIDDLRFGRHEITADVADNVSNWSFESIWIERVLAPRWIKRFVPTPTQPPVFAKPEGRAPNLVVLVHGCCTNANDVKKDWYSFAQLIADQTPEGWEIVVWDWHKYTPKAPELQDWVKPLREAYEKAISQGSILANTIADHTYKHVHLIGHSAGSRLVQGAAEELVIKYKLRNEDTFIHLTFLDAYTPYNSDTRTYGFLPNYPNHYSEHYVDKGLLHTDEHLKNAFNFDITNWKGANKGNPLLFGHWWPVNWYKKSVTTSGFNYGFPRSREGGDKEFDQLSTWFPPNEECKLYDESHHVYGKMCL